MFFFEETCQKDKAKRYQERSQDAARTFIKESKIVKVEQLINPIKKIRVVGSVDTLSHKIVGKISWSSVPGLVYIDVSENVLDKYVTVLKVKLASPIELYSGKGGL